MLCNYKKNKMKKSENPRRYWPPGFFAAEKRSKIQAMG